MIFFRILPDDITHSVNQQVTAMVTYSLLPDIARYVAAVNITEARFLPQLDRPVDRRNGCRLDILHFVAGMKAAEMPGRFRPQGMDKIGQLL